MEQTELKNLVQSQMEFVEGEGNVNLGFVYERLDDIAVLISNKEFIDEFKDAVDQIVDQNDNGHFDEEDLELLKDIFVSKKNQFSNIMHFCQNLIKIFVNLIGKFEGTTLRYDHEALESLFFGVFGYILFTQSDESDRTKKNIASVVVSIYDVIKTIDNTLEVTNNVIKLIKSNDLCPCMSNNNKHEKLDREVSKQRSILKDTSASMRNSHALEQELKLLRQKVDSLETK